MTVYSYLKIVLKRKGRKDAKTAKKLIVIVRTQSDSQCQINSNPDHD